MVSTQRLITQHTQVLFNAGPPVRRWPSVKICTTSSIHRLHSRPQHADLGATMLTQLHTAGWCLILILLI